MCSLYCLLSDGQSLTNSVNLFLRGGDQKKRWKEIMRIILRGERRENNGMKKKVERKEVAKKL